MRKGGRLGGREWAAPLCPELVEDCDVGVCVVDVVGVGRVLVPRPLVRCRHIWRAVVVA